MSCFFSPNTPRATGDPRIPLRPTFTVLTIPERKLGRNLLRFVKFTTRFYNILPFFSSFFLHLSLSLSAPNDLFINRYLAPLCFLYTLLFQILFLITYIIDHKSLLVSYANSTLMNRVIIGIEEDLILMKLREKYKIIYNII